MAKQGHTGRSSFQAQWLNEPVYKGWLQQVQDDKYSASCSLCHKVFSLSSMGRTAITSHMRGSKHIDRYKSSRISSTNIGTFFSSATSSSASPAVGVSTSEVSVTQTSSSSSATTVSPATSVEGKPQHFLEATSKPANLQRYLLNDDVTKAEVLWAIQCVMTHKSMRSAASDVSLFLEMFPDSQIAGKMKMQKDKISYTIVFGLAPYFRQELLKLCQTNCIVIGFDESLNKVSQRQQMDINVRFWDDVKDEVSVRYFTSAFLDRSRAVDLLEAFQKAMTPLESKKILQISMDGPNVNFKFLKDLKETLKTNENDPVPLDIGTCGLHTMHCAFKAGVNGTGWNIVQFLRALYNVFKNVPARRAQFVSITGCKMFPLKFCAVRWLENTSVAQRAIDILPHVIVYVETVAKEKLEPSSDSFCILKNQVKDPMLGPKLAFFKTIASDCEPFLREFQSDWPLVPFLYNALNSVVQTVMGRFVKPTSLKMSTDVEDEDKLLPVKKVDLGFSTNAAIRKCCGVKEIEILKFRNDCKKGLQKFVKKMMTRSPLKFKLTKALSCFDPTVAIDESGSKRLQEMLTILVDNNWVDGTTADRAVQQYKQICLKKESRDAFRKFVRTSNRVDHFWKSLLCTVDAETEALSKVLRTVLTMSHGNASVERGFSLNADCLIDNMKEETLIAHRCVYDAVRYLGGVQSVPLTKPIIHAARSAHARFTEAQHERKKTMSAQLEEAHRRKQSDLAVKELEAKRRKILEEARAEACKIDDELAGLKKKVK